MESTPPPVPPPTPLTPSSVPAPPRRGWWSRNWKWFVPAGCLTLIAVFVAFILCIVFFVFSVIKSSDAYKTALERAKNDQRVIAALGTPIKDGLVPSGKTNVNGSAGEADIAIPISGPKGKGTIYAVGTKSGGQWEFSKLSVQIQNGETIDLKGSSRAPARESEEENSNEETSDERVESITLARDNGGRLQPVENFKPSDNPEHVVVKLAEGAEGTHVKTVWTNLNAGGATNQKLWTKELVPDDEDRAADFSLSNSNNKLFPTGDYKIDVYLDDELVQTVRYKVK